MANTKKSKPDFHGAMPGEKSKEMYEDFLADLRKKYPGVDRIRDGKVTPGFLVPEPEGTVVCVEKGRSDRRAVQGLTPLLNATKPCDAPSSAR